MKKLTKIISLILSLVLAASSLAAISAFAAPTAADNKALVPDKALDGYIYVAYESEQKYKYDISDGVFDGIAFGESVIIEAASSKNSNVWVPSKNYTRLFVVALANIELSRGVDSYIEDANKVTIDLNGNTFSITGVLQVGRSNAAPVSAELHLRNGTLMLEEGNSYKNQLFSPKIDSKLSFENVHIKNGTTNKWSVLTYDGGAASVIFKNSIIDIGSKKLMTLSPAYAGVNCNCEICAENRRAQGIEQHRSQYVFDSTTVLSASCLLSQQANKCGMGGAKTIALADLYFKNGTKIKSAKGDWASLFNFNMSDASYKGSERKIYVEEGTSFNNSEILTSTVGDRFEIFYVDKDGIALGDNKQLANSGISDFPYMLCDEVFEVSWHSHLGVLLESVTYAKGAPPSYTAPAHPTPFSVVDGVPLMKRHSGWTLTEGQETPDDIIAVDRAMSLYATYTDELAAIAIYDAEGNPFDGWAESVITDDIVDAIIEGASLRLYTDAELRAALPSDLSYEINLGGNVLSVANSICTPSFDKAIAVRNGTLYSEGTSAIISGGEGAIELYDVTLRAVGAPAAVIEMGRVDMFGGALRTDAVGAELSGIVVNASSDVVVSFGGTYIETNDSTGGANAVTVKPTENGVNVSVFFGAYRDVMTDIAMGTAPVKIDFSEATASVDVTADSVNLFHVGNLVAFVNTDAQDRDRVRIIAANAQLAAQNSGALAISPDGKPLYSPADPTLPIRPIDGGVDLDMYTSLYIWESLKIVLYIPTDSDIASVSLGGVTAFDAALADTYSTEIIEGRECYRAVSSYFAPSAALDDVALTRFFESDGEEYRYDTKYSIIDYCSEILLGDYVDEAKTLVLDTLVYIRDAFTFFSESQFKSRALRGINALIGDYVNTSAIEDGANTLDELQGLVSQVYFTAGAIPSITLTLTEAAQDMEIVVYTAHILPVVIAAGEAEGTVTVELPLFSLNDTVNVRIGGKRATYSFAAYVSALSDGYASLGNSLTDACEALWRLGESARAYKDFKDGIGTPDTPIVSPK